MSMYPDYNAYYVKQIGPERLAWLDSLPLEEELEISGVVAIPACLALSELRRASCMLVSFFLTLTGELFC